MNGFVWIRLLSLSKLKKYFTNLIQDIFQGKQDFSNVYLMYWKVMVFSWYTAISWYNSVSMIVLTKLVSKPWNTNIYTNQVLWFFFCRPGRGHGAWINHILMNEYRSRFQRATCSARLVTLIFLFTLLQGEEWVLIEKDSRHLSESWDLGVCSNLTNKDLNSMKDAYDGYTFRLIIGTSVWFLL